VDSARLVADLDSLQRRAVTTTAAPLRILAGAGSGKTRVLTRRIAHRVATGEADPRHVLALTFTRKAAGEMRSRLRQLGLRDELAAGTFHAVAYAQLRNLWADRGQRPWELVDRKVPLVADLLPRGGRGGTTALDVVGEIEWAKARQISPEAYRAAVTESDRRPGVDPTTVVEVYTRYEEQKKRRRLLDFDDLLDGWRRAIERGDDFAQAQRWRFRHVFVDEFQDVNPLQHAVLKALLALLGLRRVEERVRGFLELLASEYGQPCEQGLLLDLRLTHQDMAGALATTRVTVTRVLGMLREEGWLQLDERRRLVIAHLPRNGASTMGT